MAVYKPTMSDVYLQEFADFMRNFGRVAIPKELPYCFCRRWRSCCRKCLENSFRLENQKNWQKETKPEGSMAIHFKQAFHGRSGFIH